MFVIIKVVTENNDTFYKCPKNLYFKGRERTHSRRGQLLMTDNIKEAHQFRYQRHADKIAAELGYPRDAISFICTKVERVDFKKLDELEAWVEANKADIREYDTYKYLSDDGKTTGYYIRYDPVENI